VRRSFLQINLVERAAIGKVGFAGFVPAAKRFLNAEEFERGELLGVFGLRFG
jgi:hypothetical protein